MTAAPCQDHPGVVGTGRCHRCRRTLCDVCTFEFSGIPFCPECVTAGPSPAERSRVLTGGFVSVALAVIGFVIMVALMAMGAAGVKPGGHFGVPLSALSIAWLACSVSGLAFAIVARDGARRTGSVVPMIGLVTSGLLLAVQVVFVVMGTSR